MVQGEEQVVSDSFEVILYSEGGHWPVRIWMDSRRLIMDRPPSLRAHSRAGLLHSQGPTGQHGLSLPRRAFSTWVGLPTVPLGTGDAI